VERVRGENRVERRVRLVLLERLREDPCLGRAPRRVHAERRARLERDNVESRRDERARERPRTCSDLEYARTHRQSHRVSRVPHSVHGHVRAA
jgi:hypothetical protein